MRRCGRIAALGVALWLTGCTPTPRAGARPAAEFLIVSDDSTAWVRSSADTVIVQRAPMLVAVLDGRLIEIYVADDAINFRDATFLVNRVYRRDLVSGDSTLVFADSAVLRDAMTYLRTHPDAERLDDDEAPADGARTFESAITPTAVVGTTLGLEVHGDHGTGELGTHDSYRATIDLIRGRRLSLSEIVTPAQAAATIATVRRNLAAAVVLAGRREGAVGKAASRAIAALPFDSLSFTLARNGDSLAVQFLVHHEQVIDEVHDTHRFALEPVALPAPTWWTVARRPLPRLLTDSTTRFDVGTVSLDVRYDADDVALVEARTGTATRMMTRMRGPLRSVIIVGDSLIAPRGQWRLALKRAFAESGYYSEQVRAASLRNRARPSGFRQAAL